MTPQERETELLRVIPDDVWNAVMEGRNIDAVRGLRHQPGLTLTMSYEMVRTMQKMLGIRVMSPLNERYK